MQVRAVGAPMKRPLATATGSIKVAPLLLVDLQTDGGIVGRAYLFGIAPQTLAPLAKLVEAMGEMVAGDALAPFELEKKLRSRHALLGDLKPSGLTQPGWDGYTSMRSSTRPASRWAKMLLPGPNCVRNWEPV